MSMLRVRLPPSWGDKRLERPEFSEHQRGGGGLMVWTGVSWKGKMSLVVVENTIDECGCTTILDDVYQPFVKEFCPNGRVFHQDCAHGEAHPGVLYYGRYDRPVMTRTITGHERNRELLGDVSSILLGT